MSKRGYRRTPREWWGDTRQWGEDKLDDAGGWLQNQPRAVVVSIIVIVVLLLLALIVFGVFHNPWPINL